ncbi:MAG: endonuclease [Muribaculum sp.]|nr:endonuclease [Muribaculum sp.]
MKHSIFFALAAICSTALAQAPADYYSSLEGKCGAALMQAAKDRVKNHTVISYGNNTWEAFRTTDVREVDGKEYWWDMYSNNLVLVSSGHDGLNIEHSVANSWWGKTKNDAYKDLFHLNPSNAEANNRKANYPLGEIYGNPTWTNGVTNVGYPVNGQGGGCTYVYEPADDYKGDFARTFMYIFTVYNDISWKDNTAWMYSTSNVTLFKPWAVELLLRWSEEDPVDAKEASRNEAIYKIQKNRNPFIDCPQLAEYIWGSKSTVPFYFGNVENPDPNPGPTPSAQTTLLEENFDSSSNLPAGWGNDVTQGDLTGWFVKEYSGNRYASASAYKGTADGGPYEEWLVTPAITVAEDAEATLSFRTQGAYGCDDSYMEVYLLDGPDPATAQRVKLPAAICTPQPDGAKPVYSDWMQSGDLALDAAGKTVYIGFLYYSAQGGSGHSATYCLDDVKVIATKTSGVQSLQQSIPAVTVEDGSVTAPEGSRVFDLNGRPVEPSGLQPGLYIVAVPGRGAVKIMVR